MDATRTPGGYGPPPQALRAHLWPGPIEGQPPTLIETGRKALEAIETLERTRASERKARQEALTAPRVDAERDKSANAEGKPLPKATEPAKKEARERAKRAQKLAERDATAAVAEHEAAIVEHLPTLIDSQHETLAGEVATVRELVDQLEAAFAGAWQASGVLRALYTYNLSPNERMRRFDRPGNPQLVSHSPATNSTRDREVSANPNSMLPALRELAELCNIERPKPPTPEEQDVQASRQAWAKLARGGVHVG